MNLFVYNHTDLNVDYFIANPELTITVPSISLEDGTIAKKKVILYTLHHNLKMYRIESSYFRTFWASQDHSLIVYNLDKGIYEATPTELSQLTDKKHTFFIVYRPQSLVKGRLPIFTDDSIKGDHILVPLSDIYIKFDPNITTAGDFSVEDYYTFTTSSGVFVMDTIAVYRPLQKGAIKECENKLWTVKNILSPANGELQFTPKQAIVYGIYKLTKSEKGRKLLSDLLGTEITEQLNNKKLVKLLTNIAPQKPQVLDIIKNIGLSETIRYPQTLSLLDFNYKKKEQLTGNREKDAKILDVITEDIKQYFPKADIVNSGARASWDQVRQMVASRGYVSNFWGEIVPVPINSSYTDGLNEEEYFISSYGTRKSLLDIAENTSKSGFLTRKMVYGLMSCELDNSKNCKTKYCAMLKVDSIELANAIKGRYYYETPESNLLRVDDPNQIIGKTIYLRSPLYCTTEGICKTCYGDLYKIQNSRYIGIIAAQTLGERSTQLILRTFHTGGVAQGKTLDKQDDIASSLSDVNTIDRSIPIESYQDAFDYTVNLWKLFSKYGNLHLVHFEILTSQRLWAILPNGKMVRVRQHQDELAKLEQHDEYGNIVSMDYKLRLQAIHTVPSLESWFLGLVFQNVRENFIKGFLHPSDKLTIIEKIILGKI